MFLQSLAKLTVAVIPRCNCICCSKRVVKRPDTNGNRDIREEGSDGARKPTHLTPDYPSATKSSSKQLSPRYGSVPGASAVIRFRMSYILSGICHSDFLSFPLFPFELRFCTQFMPTSRFHSNCHSAVTQARSDQLV